jgi:hypothetical protein
MSAAKARGERAAVFRLAEQPATPAALNGVGGAEHRKLADSVDLRSATLARPREQLAGTRPPGSGEHRPRSELQQAL